LNSEIRDIGGNKDDFGMNSSNGAIEKIEYNNPKKFEEYLIPEDNVNEPAINFAKLTSNPFAKNVENVKTHSILDDSNTTNQLTFTANNLSNNMQSFQSNQVKSDQNPKASPMMINSNQTKLKSDPNGMTNNNLNSLSSQPNDLFTALTNKLVNLPQNRDQQLQNTFDFASNTNPFGQNTNQNDQIGSDIFKTSQNIQRKR